MKNVVITALVLLICSGSFAAETNQNVVNLLRMSRKIDLGDGKTVVVSPIKFQDGGSARSFCHTVGLKLADLRTVVNIAIANARETEKGNKMLAHEVQFEVKRTDPKTGQTISETGFWAWDNTSESYKRKFDGDKDTRVVVRFRGTTEEIPTTLELVKNSVGKNGKLEFFDSKDPVTGLPAICN